MKWLYISVVGSTETSRLFRQTIKSMQSSCWMRWRMPKECLCMQSRISWFTFDSRTREVSSLKDSARALEITLGSVFIRSWGNWTFHLTTPLRKTKPGSKPRSNWNATGSKRGRHPNLTRNLGSKSRLKQTCPHPSSTGRSVLRQEKCSGKPSQKASPTELGKRIGLNGSQGHRQVRGRGASMSALWGIAITPNLWARLQRDTAARITDHAHCSVLIVKQVTGSFLV